MTFSMYDKVKLKTGETAFIVEIYNSGEAYEMDINQPDGSILTDTVWPEQIAKKLN